MDFCSEILIFLVVFGTSCLNDLFLTCWLTSFHYMYNNGFCLVWSLLIVILSIRDFFVRCQPLSPYISHRCVCSSWALIVLWWYSTELFWTQSELLHVNWKPQCLTQGTHLTNGGSYYSYQPALDIFNHQVSVTLNYRKHPSHSFPKCSVRPWPPWLPKIQHYRTKVANTFSMNIGWQTLEKAKISKAKIRQTFFGKLTNWVRYQLYLTQENMMLSNFPIRWFQIYIQLTYAQLFNFNICLAKWLIEFPILSLEFLYFPFLSFFHYSSLFYTPVQNNPG